nr:hypothetical protein [Tanacetum cinerariifolium]
MEAPQKTVDEHHQSTHRRSRSGLWYPGRMYVSGRVDIFDMVDNDLFTVIALNMMVLKFGYTDSYLRAPRFKVTIEEITDEPGSIAANTTEKMLLLTWHESSETSKEPVCDSVTPISLPQHNSSTPFETQFEFPVSEEQDVGRTQDPILAEVSTQEPIVVEVSTKVPIVEEVITREFSVEDVVLEDYVSFEEDVEQYNGEFDESARSDGQFFFDDEGIDTEYDIQSSEDAGTDDDDDDVDEFFLVDKENELVEPDVDVHLFGISMDLPFDNIGVTNLVSDDVLKGEYVDVINADGFDSDPGNDEETNYRKRRRNLKFYKNDGVRIRARCDEKVLVFTMSQAKAKVEREIIGDHVLQYSMLKDYVIELQSTNPNTTIKIALERNTDPSLPTGVFQRIYGPFPGQVLVAVGLDSNNGIYPLTYALIEAEKASGSAFRQAQQTEPTVSQDGSGELSVGVVIGLSAAIGEGGAGVASQGSSHSRWTKRRVQTERISPQKRTYTQPESQPSTSSQVPVSETVNADEKEMVSDNGNFSMVKEEEVTSKKLALMAKEMIMLIEVLERKCISPYDSHPPVAITKNMSTVIDNRKFMMVDEEDLIFKKISPMAEEILEMLRVCVAKKIKVSDFVWYNDEIREHVEKLADG